MLQDPCRIWQIPVLQITNGSQSGARYASRRENHSLHRQQKLTFRNLNSAWVFCWRLAINDFDATFQYIEGKNNLLGDAISRLPWLDISTTEGTTSDPSDESLFFSLLDQPELAERNPLDPQWMQENQFEDEVLNAR
jgi:hypothetical protein